MPVRGAAIPAGEEGGDELARLALRERLEGDGRVVAAPAAPARPSLQELVARQADDQRWPADPARHVIDQVEHSLVGPVDVLDRDHDWPALACRLDQRSNR